MHAALLSHWNELQYVTESGFFNFLRVYCQQCTIVISQEPYCGTCQLALTWQNFVIITYEIVACRQLDVERPVKALDVERPVFPVCVCCTYSLKISGKTTLLLSLRHCF